MAAQYIQQVFNSLAGSTASLNTTVDAVSNVTATVPSPSPLGGPSMGDIAGIITLLTTFSGFSGIRDWLKIVVIGGFFESCRRLFSSVYDTALEKFWVSATIRGEDPSFEWMMVWLSKQPSWSNSRSVEISTFSYGNSSTAILVDTEDDDAFSKGSKKLTYLPSISRQYSLWYKRRLVYITRTQEQTGYYGSKENTLHISIFTRSHSILLDMLSEARKQYMAAQEHSMCVYVSDIHNNWKHVACRKKRPMSSVVLDPGIKDLILDDARDFLDSKEWYGERGIPFRRGYLLYGAPGSGKTSLIHCLAGELNLDVYVISLSRAGLDDTALDELVNDLPERCVALMEDIDAAFTHALNRDATSSKPGEADKAPPPPTTSVSAAPTSRLSLSGLLNALDGVSAQEGRILFATTNKYESLDPALCRPGRMDLHIEFTLASRYQARELFTRFYLPGTPPASGLSQVEDEKEEQEEKAAVDVKPVTDKKESASPNASDSGYSSRTPSPERTSTSLSSDPEKPHFSGERHSDRGPKLTRRKARELAQQFADSIPEKEMSMASLQGYLMQYKTRPYEALKQAPSWVERQREDRAAKAAREAKEKEEREQKEKEEKEKKEKEEKEKKEKEEKEKKEKDEKDAKDKEKTDSKDNDRTPKTNTTETLKA